MGVLGMDLRETTLTDWSEPAALTGTTIDPDDCLSLAGLIRTGDDDQVSDDGWRRMAPSGDLGSPHDILLATPLCHGGLAGVRHVIVIGASPLHPVGSLAVTKRYGGQSDAGEQCPEKKRMAARESHQEVFLLESPMVDETAEIADGLALPWHELPPITRKCSLAAAILSSREPEN